MRNFFLKKITLIFVFLILMCGAVACGKINLNLVNKNYISEYRKNLFVAKTGMFVATFSSGEREVNYQMDGIKTTLTDFGVLTLYFSTPIEKLPSFDLTINGGATINGILEKNPYDSTFVFDIEKQIDDNDELVLKLNDYDIVSTFVCVSKDWEVDCFETIEIFNQNFNKKINEHTKNSKLDGEIYIKIVSNDKSLTNIYWYVLCVCEDGDIFACLIDPNTKQILQS